MNNLALFITRQGIEKAKAELVFFQQRRQETVDQIVSARALGDLRENGAYISAKQAQGEIDRKIAMLDEVISRARIIDLEEITCTETAKFGLRVHIEHEDGKEDKYHIVSQYESTAQEEHNVNSANDNSHRKLSILSPIGRAMIGKKADEWIDVDMPNGSVKSFKIINIYK